jgi:hypothetical protein
MAFRLGRKESATLQAILLFFIISHPMTYRLTNSLVGGLTTMAGAPTTLGLVLHSLVFGAIVYGLMYL